MLWLADEMGCCWGFGVGDYHRDDHQVVFPCQSVESYGFHYTSCDDDAAGKGSQHPHEADDSSSCLHDDGRWDARSNLSIGEKVGKSSRNLSREEVPQKGGEVWIYLDLHTCTKDSSMNSVVQKQCPG